MPQYANQMMGYDEALGLSPPARHAHRVPSPQHVQALVPHIPGAPARGLRRFFLPLGRVQFVNAGPTTLQMTALTQKPFKGERMVLTPARQGATAANQLITLNNFSAGTDPQQASLNDAPIDGFAANVFDAYIDMDPVTPGVTVSLNISITGVALGVGDTITVSGLIFGTTIA